MIKKAILLVLLFAGGCLLYSQSLDNTADLIRMYNEQKAEVVVFEPRFVVEEAGPIDKKNYPYTVNLGDGSEVKLSFLAAEMGNPFVSRNLKWGEAFKPLAGGLLASILTTLTLDITGAALLGVFGYYTKDLNLKAVSYDDRDWALMTAGVVMFAISGLSIASLITFAVLTARAYKHKMNVIQAQSIVNRYNNFLKKKLGLPMDMSFNFNHNNVEFALAYKF